MHELLLFAQVPPSRHNYVLNVLTGLAAMQPQPILEKHLIFKPARLPAAARPAHVGAFQGVQNSQLQALQGQTSGDLYYLQLVGDIGARGSGRRGLREGEEGVIDVLMGEGNGDVQLEGKVRCRSLISLSPAHIVAESYAKGGHSASNASQQRDCRQHPELDPPIPRPP
jgi:hypothetical protein